jgi:hypothetical protein
MRKIGWSLGWLALAVLPAGASALDWELSGIQPVNHSEYYAGVFDKGEAGCDVPTGHGCADGCRPVHGICEPLWNVYVGAVILEQSNPRTVPLFDYGWEGGVDLDVRRRLGSDYLLQVRYFGVDGWSDQFPVDFPLLTQSSSLHSTEVNLRRQWNDWLTVLGGFRWVELSEDFLILGGLAGINTNNHMYGGQIGAEFRVWDRGGPFTVTSGAKAGIYYNRADYETFLFQLRDRTDHTAFLGELDVTARYQLSQNLYLRGGYQLLWIEGVARSDDQLAQIFQDGGVSTSGSPFYHGAMIGAEFRF